MVTSDHFTISPFATALRSETPWASPIRERSQGRGVLGRHETPVHSVASLPVQLFSGGQVPLGRRRYIAPEPGGGPRRLPSKGGVGDTDA